MKYENVYLVEEENSHRFYQMPKELFLNEKYKELSLAAKVTYTLLLDRKELSRKSGWVDKYGQVYLIYTKEKVAEMLSLSIRSTHRAFKELNECQLIIEERQGLNKPNKIYITRMEYGYAKLAHQEMPIWHTIDTEGIETELNNNPERRDNAFQEKAPTFFLQDSQSLGFLEPNVIQVIQIYASLYKETLFKAHPRIKKEQLEKIAENISNFDFLDIEEWGSLISDYFTNENYGDGNINRFFYGNEHQGVIAGMLINR